MSSVRERQPFHGNFEHKHRGNVEEETIKELFRSMVPLLMVLKVVPNLVLCINTDSCKGSHQ